MPPRRRTGEPAASRRPTEPPSLDVAVRAARRTVGGTLADLTGAVGLLEALDRDLRERPVEVLRPDRPDLAERPDVIERPDVDEVIRVPAIEGRIEDVCRRLLDVVRERAPQLLPPDPLSAGTLGAPVPVVRDELPKLVAAAAWAGTVGGTPESERTPAVVWREGADALLIDVGGVTATTSTGWVVIRIPVACDQLPDRRADVEVPFAVGSPDRPAGLVAATETVPRGPAVVVARWGEALVALAWRAMLDGVAGLAAEAGRDVDGAPLVPVALVATERGLAVLPQARHGFDRLPPPSATGAERPAPVLARDALLRGGPLLRGGTR